MHPPRQLSALTSLRALYLDYNQFGTEDEGVLQQACRCGGEGLQGCMCPRHAEAAWAVWLGRAELALATQPPCRQRASPPPALPHAARSEALAPLTGLQALGLSHNLLDSWPEAAERLPQLAVL